MRATLTSVKSAQLTRHPRSFRRSPSNARHRSRVHGVTAASSTPSLPISTKEQIGQAAEAIKAALGDGIETQSITLNLPLIGATDLDDWPGGIRQQYGALAPMIGEVLKKLNEDASGKCQQRIIDDADAVAAITLESDVIVSFPTAEVLDDLRDIEKQKYRLKIIANPQWNTSGAIIGDFGFGPWKKRAEDFVGKFEEVYFLNEQRIQGEIVRTLKVYPDKFRAFALSPDAENKVVPELLGVFDERPMYDELKKILESREGSIAAMNWVERAKREAMFNAESLKTPPSQE